MKANITLLAVVILLLSENASLLSAVNVTRLQESDKFTNPNRTAVSNCVTSGQSSFPDSCRSFRSTDTRAACSNSNSCCQWCQCKDDYPIYLFHLGKCVNLSELNTDIFGQGSIGKSICILTFYIHRRLLVYIKSSLDSETLTPTGQNTQASKSCFT